MIQAIKELTALWYSLLIDHHKDRDCHFFVTNKFSYDGEEKWYAFHEGYIAGDWYSEYFNTKEETYKYLLKKLANQCREEIKHFIEHPETIDDIVPANFYVKKIEELRRINEQYQNRTRR